MENSLTPSMQKRLDKWRKNTLPVKSVDILKGKSPGNFVPRRRDHGDDMNEFDEMKKGKK